MIDRTNRNTLWASLIVEELLRLGASYFVISPGSRSTPLTVAVARHPRTEHLIAYDERGAAFHALGYARATGRPAVLICTSGTAAANYLPAVIEASLEGIPMLLLTADRPPELRDTGANQTIRQPGIYTHYVRWEFDLPAPDFQIPPTMVLTTVDQSWHRAMATPPGPVHLNCMFREPLAPTPETVPARYLRKLKGWQESSRPYTAYSQAPSIPSDDPIRRIKTLLLGSRRGLIVLGWPGIRYPFQALVKLIRRLNWPVFADIRSGMRLLSEAFPVIPYFDQLLHSKTLQKQLNVDTILHLGSPVTSKRYLQWLEAYPPRHYIHVAPHPARHDPGHCITLRLQAELEPFVERLFGTEIPVPPSSVLQKLKQANRRVAAILEEALAAFPRISEISVARLIATLVPETHLLFAGNSMPIRELDMFSPPAGKNLRVEGNRGASGIDGLIATATGLAVGRQQPVTAIVGDLSVLHDMNSLLLVQRVTVPVLLIVVNNHGGGIFEFLPIARFQDVFEPFFRTPHHLTFEKLASFAGMAYRNPTSLDALQREYQAALHQSRSTLIEVHTNARENRDLQEGIRRRILEALGD